MKKKRTDQKRERKIGRKRAIKKSFTVGTPLWSSTRFRLRWFGRRTPAPPCFWWELSCSAWEGSPEARLNSMRRKTRGPRGRLNKIRRPTSGNWESIGNWKERKEEEKTKKERQYVVIEVHKKCRRRESSDCAGSSKVWKDHFDWGVSDLAGQEETTVAGHNVWRVVL